MTTKRDVIDFETTGRIKVPRHQDKGTLDEALIVQTKLIEIHRDLCRIREFARDFNARFKFSLEFHEITVCSESGSFANVRHRFSSRLPAIPEDFFHVSARKQRDG